MQKIIISLLLVAFCKTAMAQVSQPRELRCEYQLNPLGIDVTKPMLSWSFTASERNFYQSAYEILVTENPNLEPAKQAGVAVWSSGKISSNQNTGIEYGGKPLQSGRRYYWRVRVYDRTGQVSEWSDIAWFETGLLNDTDWKAKWIDDGRKQFEHEEDFYKDDAMPLFKKEFIAKKPVSSARLYIAGLGYYEAYLNNAKVSQNRLDPGFTAYRKQVLYVTHDISSQVRKGKNIIGVMLGNGWYNPLPLRLFGRFNLRDVQETGRPKMIAQIEIQYKDGSIETIVSDESWQTAEGPVTRNSVYLGEHYDARMEKEFSATQHWKPAQLAVAPSGQLSAQMQPPIQVTKVLHPKSIRWINKDTFLVDMGQNFAGVARIKVKGPSGTTIGIRYGEDTFQNGRLNYLTTVAGQIKEIWRVNGGPGSPKTAWQRDQYTLKGDGTEIWSPRFTFHGFRYVEITGWPGRPSLSDIEGLRMNASFETDGSFSCSDSMFNKIHEVVQWTFLSNVFSVQSDCPGREKMGYGGDMVATSEAFIYNYNMAGFYRKTVNDFLNDQQPDGGITEIAPSTGIADRGYGGMSGPLGWQLAFPFLQKQLYQYYGDKRIIEQYYPAFCKQMEFLQSKSQQGLFFWDISDHEALDTKPEALTAAAFYYHHARLAAEFASILGKAEDSMRFSKLAGNIKSAIQDRYMVRNTGRIDNGTQSAQLFGLWYNLTNDKAKSLQSLEEEFSRHRNHVSTGIFSTKMLFDVLRENDMQELAFKIVDQADFPGWKHMIRNGATTLWETWQYPDNGPSQNHPMFGSVDEWFYKSVLGINAAAPGFSKIIIKPQPAGSLTWAKGSYKSVKGLIESSWRNSANSFQLSVTIPGNTTALVYLPFSGKGVVTESGKSVDSIEGIKSIGKQGNYFVLEVGSGNFQFEIK